MLRKRSKDLVPLSELYNKGQSLSVLSDLNHPKQFLDTHFKESALKFPKYIEEVRKNVPSKRVSFFLLPALVLELPQLNVNAL